MIYLVTSRIHLLIFVGVIVLVFVLLQPPVHLFASDQEFPGFAFPNRVFGIALFGNGSDDRLELFVGELTHFVLDGLIRMEVAVEVGHALGDLECLISISINVYSQQRPIGDPVLIVRPLTLTANSSGVGTFIASTLAS